MRPSANLESFNFWIGHALSDLTKLPGRDLPISRRLSLEWAMSSMPRALKRANQMNCPARRALCMRVMNWIRADLRALPC